MRQVYIFSGLGADETVFRHLDFSGFETTFIRWITPTGNESIESYARRLLAQITTVQPILLGLSFGGMMAVEVAKLIDTEKIILIASAKTQREIPFYYRMAGRCGLHRLLPIQFLKRANTITYWFFGTRNEEERKMLKGILLRTDAVFLKWAIGTIVRWKNRVQHPNLKHVHGTADRILPFRYVRCDVKVKGGGHLMTVNKSEELAWIIRTLL